MMMAVFITRFAIIVPIIAWIVACGLCCLPYYLSGIGKTKLKKKSRKKLNKEEEKIQKHEAVSIFSSVHII